MHVFETVVVLLLIGAALAALARRIGAPYPALLALAGAGLALVPGTPAVHLDPELALALFVAPVLLDAAFDASVRDLRHNWRPVAGLALLTVGITVAVVAVTVRLLRLSELRADGTIGDDAFHRVEEELDRAELGAQAMDPDG